MGPTASGKTETAVKLGDIFPFDLISVDATQVYRGMDIGSAKPDPATLRRAPHRLIDICDPSERYSAGRFRDDALAEIAKIHGRGRIPLLVGGTMFYFHALYKGLSDLPQASDDVGKEIRARAEAAGWPALHEELARLDPQSAESIDPNDSQRIQRMLVIHALEGKSASQAKRDSPAEPMPYNCVKLAVTAGDRGDLRERIARRFDAMIESGLLDEVEALRSRTDLNPSLPSIKSVGYRQAWQHLEGKIDRQTMASKAVQDTCAIAKRQLTWLRNDAETTWMDTGAAGALNLASDYLSAKLQRTN